MESADHEKYIRMAMAQAEIAVEEGNRPFGAIFLDSEGNVVWEDHDRSAALSDPTAHAEMNGIRGLCGEHQTLFLEGHSVYTNTEPCPACLATMIRVKIEALYFGCRTEATASVAIPAEVLASYATKHDITIVGGILDAETREHRDRLLNEP